MKAGDVDQEFLELVNRCQPVIHKVCWMYADRPEDRQDLFQEILFQLDRKSTRLNSSHIQKSRMPSSA